MEYHKLVRDKIPQIIEAQGQRPLIQILEKEEYSRALEQKLDEEVAEFHADKSKEELADILEVVFALAEDLGLAVGELMEVYRQKHDQCGGFRDRIFLISKEG